MRSLKKNKKGVIVIWILFIVLTLSLILATAIFAPVGNKVSIVAYQQGEEIMLSSNDTINKIQNTEVREAIRASNNEAQNSQEFNAGLTSDMYLYSGFIIIALAGLFIFIQTRRVIEVGGGFV